MAKWKLAAQMNNADIYSDGKRVIRIVGGYAREAHPGEHNQFNTDYLV